MFRRLLDMFGRATAPIPKPDLSALSQVGDGPDRARQLLKLWWEATGSDVATEPNIPVSVSRLWAKYDVSLPPDFEAYLLKDCPTSETMDREMGTWWPLARIRNLVEEEGCRSPELPDDGQRYLLFADFLIWSSAWAICCEPGPDYGNVVRVSDRITVVADGFTDFVERYTSDWQSIG